MIVVVNEKSVEVLPEEVELMNAPHEEYSVIEEHGMLVGVYTMITDDLMSEGLARDIVRRIQSPDRTREPRRR